MFEANYPYVNIWKNLDTVEVFIADCYSHLENWMIHIRGLFRCQKYRHYGQRKLIVKLHVAKYKLEPDINKQKMN